MENTIDHPTASKDYVTIFIAKIESTREKTQIQTRQDVGAKKTLTGHPGVLVLSDDVLFNPFVFPPSV